MFPGKLFLVILNNYISSLCCANHSNVLNIILLFHFYLSLSGFGLLIFFADQQRSITTLLFEAVLYTRLHLIRVKCLKNVICFFPALFSGSPAERLLHEMELNHEEERETLILLLQASDDESIRSDLDKMTDAVRFFLPWIVWPRCVYPNKLCFGDLFIFLFICISSCSI